MIRYGIAYNINCYIGKDKDKNEDKDKDKVWVYGRDTVNIRKCGYPESPS